jgi:predicted metal-dependent RNase
VSHVRLGGQLMNGKKEVKIFGEPYKVVAEVGSIRSMSAHGDYEDLVQFLSCQDASKVKNFFLFMGNMMYKRILLRSFNLMGLLLIYRV